jgi:hypothetical protein
MNDEQSGKYAGELRLGRVNPGAALAEETHHFTMIAMVLAH